MATEDLTQIFANHGGSITWQLEYRDGEVLTPAQAVEYSPDVLYEFKIRIVGFVELSLAEFLDQMGINAYATGMYDDEDNLLNFIQEVINRAIDRENLES